MPSKKSTATKTATPKAKYYIVMDLDQEIIAQGDWWEVKEALEDYMDGDSSDREFIDELTIHEKVARLKETWHLVEQYSRNYFIVITINKIRTRPLIYNEDSE